jgi:hypothetical protein
MTLELDAIHDGAALVRWGLQPRKRPAQEPAYESLLNRYLSSDQFREVVREVCRGLGLIVLDACEHGIVIGPTADSQFAVRPTDFRSRPSTDDRLLDGLVMIAIAATIYPTPRDLDEDPTFAKPAVTVEEVEENIRRLCERIQDENKHAPDPENPSENGDLYEAWRVYQSLPTNSEAEEGKSNRRTARRYIEFGLERLREFGCFTIESRESRTCYQPTWRYQVLVKELAAATILNRVQQLFSNQS